MPRTGWSGARCVVSAAGPPAAGQPYSYLLAQIQAWKSGTRSGEPLAMVGELATGQPLQGAALGAAAGAVGGWLYNRNEEAQ